MAGRECRRHRRVGFAGSECSRAVGAIAGATRKDTFNMTVSLLRFLGKARILESHALWRGLHRGTQRRGGIR
jgi:hypothetical protein